MEQQEVEPYTVIIWLIGYKLLAFGLLRRQVIFVDIILFVSI